MPKRKNNLLTIIKVHRIILAIAQLKTSVLNFGGISFYPTNQLPLCIKRWEVSVQVWHWDKLLHQSCSEKPRTTGRNSAYVLYPMADAKEVSVGVLVLSEPNGIFTFLGGQYVSCLPRNGCGKSLDTECDATGLWCVANGPMRSLLCNLAVTNLIGVTESFKRG